MISIYPTLFTKGFTIHSDIDVNGYLSDAFGKACERVEVRTGLNYIIPQNIDKGLCKLVLENGASYNLVKEHIF